MVDNVVLMEVFLEEMRYKEGNFLILEFNRNPNKQFGKYVVNRGNFMKKIPDIIENMKGDRLYITSVPRSFEKVNKKVMKALIDNPSQRTDKLFLSEMAKAENGVERVWKVDIDTKDFDLTTIPSEILFVFKSVKGYHVLVKPFDVRLLPNVDIQKDNLVLLYSK